MHRFNFVYIFFAFNLSMFICVLIIVLNHRRRLSGLRAELNEIDALSSQGGQSDALERGAELTDEVKEQIKKYKKGRRIK